MRSIFVLALALLVPQLGCGELDSGAGGSGGSGALGGAGSGGLAGTGGLAGAPNAALVKQWAREVALGTEYGGGSKQVARWADSPSLSVVTGSAADRVHLDELVPILNQDLGPTPIQVVADGDDSADIRVYFTPLADFTAIGQQHGFPVVPGNWGYFYMFWDGDQALTKTFVLLATDKLSGDQLRHFTFEELTQSLGLATDSDIFPDSIFYANGADGGDATELSALDRRLLWFLYAHTQPGDDQAAFDAAFDQYF
ncbi:MAG: DUF2927 domain-containing protein [Myxococcales bacterium]|nr:DUF2927 domain-containing protein [Myxococcales bacterium]